MHPPLRFLGMWERRMVRRSHVAEEERGMEQSDHGPRQVYSKITEQILAAIAAGAPRFEMPWHRSGPLLGRPRNAVSGNHYRGVNVVALWIAAQTRSFTTMSWATYRQWASLGAQVRKGEKGTVIVFYKRLEAKPAEEEGEDSLAARLIARASWVFNADQVEGLTPPEVPVLPSPVEVLNQADALIEATGATIDEGGDAACYRPHADYIQMPPRSVFIGTSTSTPTEAYYATLLHELTHWTGHERRLNRDLSRRFGDEAYAMEELVAELGAAFLCADLGVTNAPRADHAAYVGCWLRVLRNDARAIFYAAGKAGAAVEYLTSLQASGG
jgi:antirestriction protein ArdC